MIIILQLTFTQFQTIETFGSYFWIWASGLPAFNLKKDHQMDLDQARFFMVEQQIRPWDVLDPKVLDLFMEIPRHNFVPEDKIALAYSDIELPIGHNQSMLFPKVEGKILQAADIQKSDTVLEIGTGIGYLTALISQLANQVTSIEINTELQELAKTNLKELDNIKFESGDAALDWNDGALYDVIIFNGAMAFLPESYKLKLKIGGRAIVTLGNSTVMTMKIITRVSDGEWETEGLFETVMPALTNATTSPSFTF